MTPVESVHDSINPLVTRVSNYALIGLTVALILAIPAWIIIGVSNPRAVLFVVMVIPSILFLPALIFLSVVTPPVTVTADGLLLRPYVWRQRLIRWTDITLAKPYPLLPSSESEVIRRAMVATRQSSPLPTGHIRITRRWRRPSRPAARCRRPRLPPSRR
jgi:hypothetical protein